MGDDASGNLDSLRANWTPSQDQYFLELLLSQVQCGNKFVNNINKAVSRRAWAVMIQRFNSKFGFKYDTDVLKNRYKRFRKQYNDIKMIVSQNGFHWDGNQNMIIADDETWDEYIKDHPDAQAFKTRVVPNYNDLCKIFGHAIADGRYSLSCFDVGFEYEEIASKELDDQPPPGFTNQNKIDWSPMMDQCFVGLMLEQVHKGNKIGRTFKRKAWLDMTQSFNDRFGSHYGKAVLKNRLNVLRRHYCSINVLLGKEGFSWDLIQQKVVADDHVWQNCIREHHNFRLYRIKSRPFYSGMCIICRNEATGRGSSWETNAMRDSRPLPNVDKEAFHIGGEKGLNADKGALHLSGEKNSTREAQPLPNADKEPLFLGGEKIDSDPSKRHQLDMPPTLNESKKARSYNEEVAGALKHMAVAVTSLTKKTKKEDTFSIDKVINVLQAMPDMDDELILDGCDFLEDEKRARLFMALDANLRKKWLLRKLRPQ